MTHSLTDQWLLLAMVNILTISRKRWMIAVWNDRGTIAASINE